MATILELKEQQAELYNQAFFIADSDDFEDIELMAHIESELAKITDSLENKASYLSTIYLEAKYTAESRREAARRAQIRAQRAEKVQDALRGKIMEIMVLGDLYKVSGKYCNITRFEVEKILFTGDVRDLPEQYIDYQEPKPRLNDIKKAAKQGEVIEGVEFISQDSLRIA